MNENNRDIIRTVLDRKRRIDNSLVGANNNMVGYDRWLVDAVELLLQIELERQGRDEKPLRFFGEVPL
jgi:hypothetical protein